MGPLDTTLIVTIVCLILSLVLTIINIIHMIIKLKRAVSFAYNLIFHLWVAGTTGSV